MVLKPPQADALQDLSTRIGVCLCILSDCLISAVIGLLESWLFHLVYFKQQLWNKQPSEIS